MSLARTALRLGLVLALTNNSTAPYPTLAGPHVYDSRLDPLQLGTNERRPVIVIYTDKDSGTPMTPHAKMGHHKRLIDIILELTVTTRITDPENPDEAIAGTVSTDAELEATLDLLEYQTKQCLRSFTSPWVDLLRGLYIHETQFDSDRYVDAHDAVVRFAMRRVIMTVNVKDEMIEPAVIAQGDPVPGLPPAVQAIVDAVEAAETSSAYVDAIVGVIQAYGLPGPAVLPALERIRFIESDQAAKRANVARGPRPAGVAEVELPQT